MLFASAMTASRERQDVVGSRGPNCSSVIMREVRGVCERMEGRRKRELGGKAELLPLVVAETPFVVLVVSPFAMVVS